MSKAKKAPAGKQATNGTRRSVRKEVEKASVKTESASQDEVIIIDAECVVSPKRKEGSPNGATSSKRFKQDDGSAKGQKAEDEHKAMVKKEIEEVSKFLFTYEDSNSNPSVQDGNPQNGEACLSSEERQGLVKLGEETNNPDKFDYYLRNFTDAINAVLLRDEFAYVFDQKDYETIRKFQSLKRKMTSTTWSVFLRVFLRSFKFKDENKIIYVRLFQRKLTWHPIENINYLDKSNSNKKTSTDNLKDIEKMEIKPISDQESRRFLETCLSELCTEQFIFDESKIDSYEEILDLLKLPQLKQLAKWVWLTLLLGV